MVQVELLNETSFDRRRQVAVYKNDGKRGHHMQVRVRPRHPGCARLALQADAPDSRVPFSWQ